MITRADFTVLVVDDLSAARYATARALRAAGFNTVEARSGAAALELAGYASAVVLDVHLPDLHGLEVCRLLRSKPATAALPIVNVSSVYVAEADQAAGKHAGADAYFVAPVDFDQLAAKLDELLGRAAKD
ncbi:response regulator transcription factor [Ramlibacter sp.]|uniref:response regulator transcription factor n=1 Tax=Ramlibacter sp. TaxID=1917967 RepID=UPI002C7EA024|nr:response regulator [Ramlibacter sp.]HWI83000.1 response regulator [Ramlibacter sp.]